MPSFHKGPSQILVAAPAVVLALLLAVARAQASHAAAVAGEVARVGEALGVASFRCDGQAENLADARRFLQALAGGPFPDDARGYRDVRLDLPDRVGEKAARSQGSFCWARPPTLSSMRLQRALLRCRSIPTMIFIVGLRWVDGLRLSLRTHLKLLTGLPDDRVWPQPAPAHG